MSRRRYTKQEKLEAVAQATVNGAEQAAAATGIPRTTILYWLDRPEFVELRQKTNDDMRDGFVVLVHKAQERLIELVDQMEPRDLIVLMGVSTDKKQLLGGEATSRTETITDGLSPDAKRALRDRLARAVRGESDSRGADRDTERLGEPVDPAATSGAA